MTLTKGTILRAFEWRPEGDSIWKGIPVASQIFWDAHKDSIDVEVMLERLWDISRVVGAVQLPGGTRLTRQKWS